MLFNRILFIMAIAMLGANMAQAGGGNGRGGGDGQVGRHESTRTCELNKADSAGGGIGRSIILGGHELGAEGN